MSWIKVTDRLPEIDQRVLVFDKYGVHGGCQIDIEYRYDQDFWEGQGVHSSITHWMPLPLPPED